MNKIYALVLLAFFSLSTTALMAQGDAIIGPQADGAVIEFESETLDFGTLPHKGDASGTFTFWNRGTSDLLITFCKGTCGCTVPQCPTEAIKPGEKGSIKVNYDSNRVGAFTKNVNVTSNAINAPNKSLAIKGTIEAPVDAPAPDMAPSPSPSPSPAPAPVPVITKEKSATGGH
jgi:Protein of unknown function (DUF1573)